MNKLDTINNGIMGFAIGDAIGVPIEFEEREKLQNKPITTMLGFGSYDVPKGVWSDDTAMTLATIDSIINNNNKINYNDIADNFCNWINEAKYTATNEIFDIGITTKYALIRYWDNKEDATKCGGSSFSENGNGSLMRILPIAYYGYYNKLEDTKIYEIVKNISSITHRHNISIMGCYIYVLFVIELLKGNSKEDSYKYIRDYDYNMFESEIKDYYKRLLKSDISKLNINDISSSGFIVDTLEAVMWCFIRNDNYKDSVIEAINLGNDTDTIGALVGGLSGIYYGNFPTEWVNDLVNKEYLLDLCSKYNDILNN